VPEDRSQPDGRHVRLHIAIFRTRNPDPQPDPVIYLTGGGGGSELDRVQLYLDAIGDQILKNRDFVFYNQRGARYNEPTLDCPGYSDVLWELAGEEIGQEERDEREIAFLLACHDNLRAQGIDLTRYTSVANAADLNDLRLALGYDQVNLYGTSYGTKLALTTMRDYPQGIRSVIIDSVYPLQVTVYTDLAQNADRAFNVLFEDCAADAHCSQAYPDLQARLFQLVDDLNAAPQALTYQQGTILVDGPRLMDVLFGFMYYAGAIPYIPSDIDMLSSGNWQDIQPIFAAHLNAGLIAWGAHYSLVCHETISFGSYERALELAAGLPPQIADSFTSPFKFTLCASWQSGTADPIEHQAVHSEIPALVLAGRYDPITPPSYAKLAAETLSSSFTYVFPDQGHGVIRSGGCGAEIALQFLSDPSAEPDIACLEALTAPRFR
jgi:pimeloyl-ACP methyl ester carboxylesterase